MVRLSNTVGGSARAWTMPAVGVEHYENFPVASILCPPHLREPIRCIYAFARTADDIADEGDAPADERLRQLALYRQALAEVAQPRSGSAHGTATTIAGSQWPAVFAPLARALREHRLPESQLAALLDAFAQDARNPRYETRQQLLDYCSRSANPVGRLLLHLYGVDDEAARAESDAICTALQLINLWQDLSVDLPRGRVYLPLEDCRRHGIAPEQLQTRDDDAARALVADLVRWSAGLMARGVELPRRVPGRAGWELRLVMQGGWRVLQRIARLGFRSYLHRPTLSIADLPLLLARALRHSAAQFRPEALP